MANVKPPRELEIAIEALQEIAEQDGGGQPGSSPGKPSTKSNENSF